ncbi:hypothetical protein M8C21_000484 [Ambrosia artemisiifolia]|uniref:Vacuolar sorting receptor thioredoxin-like domain-containing protein n=1 Tax=Ambrosia artemisiifolia TaxID=4212 RepID=A0AAD5C7Q5_AMBAR|nr:hypothetical protein M8C21_000484 [Ambrosia artemisiifolia]
MNVSSTSFGPITMTSKGYDGKDVVVQNLRQACFYKVANKTGKPWLWWDYVTDFSIRCLMKNKKYTKECADEVIKLLGEFIKHSMLWIIDTPKNIDSVLTQSCHKKYTLGGLGDCSQEAKGIVMDIQMPGHLIPNKDEQDVLDDCFGSISVQGVMTSETRRRQLVCFNKKRAKQVLIVAIMKSGPVLDVGLDHI